MNIRKYSNEQMREFLENDPKLMSCATPEGHHDLLLNEWCLAVEENGTPQALLRCNEFTPVSIMVHIMVSTECQKLKLSHKCAQYLLEYFAQHIELRKIITAVPSNCKYAERFIKQLGFKKEATLEKIMFWKKELVDLYWYSYDLNQLRGFV